MKKAIIIGASSGIGREVARLLANEGFRIAITGRRAENLEALRRENPDQFISGLIDIQETSKITEILNKIATELGCIDLLVLSSGTGDLNEKLDFSIEENTIATNVSGFTSVADWAINYFLRQGSGHFVAITSLAGLWGSGSAPSYSASKAYQINYLSGLRQMISKSQIPVYITDIRPGFVDTEMAKGEGKFWIASPEKAAKQIFTAIRNKKTIAYVTHRWRFIALLIKLLPRWVLDRI